MADEDTTETPQDVPADGGTNPNDETPQDDPEGEDS